MKLAYEIAKQQTAEGHLELDEEQEHAFLKARTHEARRAVVEAVIHQHADDTDDWAYDTVVRFRAVPDSDDDLD